MNCFLFKVSNQFSLFSLEDFAADVGCFSLISFQKQVYTPNVPFNEALFHFSVSVQLRPNRFWMSYQSSAWKDNL